MEKLKLKMQFLDESLWNLDSYLKKAYEHLNLKSIIDMFKYKSSGILIINVLIASAMIALYNAFIIPIIRQVDIQTAVYLQLGHIILVMGLSHKFWSKNSLGFVMKGPLTVFYMSLLLFWISKWFQVELPLFTSNDWFLKLLMMTGMFILSHMCLKACTSKSIVLSNIFVLVVSHAFKLALFGTLDLQLSLGSNALLLFISIVISYALGFAILGRWSSEQKQAHEAHSRSS